MRSFESGVQYYTSAKVKIAFPENRVCCGLCPLLETYARKQCRRTGEYIVDDKTVGYWCPLELEVQSSDVSEFNGR